MPCPATSTFATSVPEVTLPLPDTTGRSVWAYLLAERYKENWSLWPGKGEKFVGGEPHGALHTVYMNPIASVALKDKVGSMPNGAIIMKENYSSDSVLQNVTIMYKVDAFNPEHNDWFWGMVTAAGEVLREGKVEGCQSCHGARADNDYVLVGDLR